MNLKDVVIANLNSLMKERSECSSQNALAKKSGVSQSHVGRILRGESTPTLEAIEALATALRISPAKLLMENAGRSDHAGPAQAVSDHARQLIELITKLDASPENRNVLEAAELLLSKALPKQEEATRGNPELKALFDQYLKDPDSATPESIAWLRMKIENAASNQPKNNNDEKKKQAGGSGA